MMDYCVCHCRHHRKIGHSLALNQLEHFSWIELLDDDVTRPHAGERLWRAPTVHVKERNRVKLNNRIVPRKPADHLQRVKVQVPVRHHYALRIRGCPRGVKQLSQIVVLDVRWRETGSSRRYQSLVVG